MLVDPSLDDLLDKVGNKFILVTLAMKRARQINDGYDFMEEGNAARPVSMALQEIYEESVCVKDSEGPEVEEVEAARALLAVEADEAIATIERAEEEEIERAAQELAAAVAESGDEAEEEG